MKNLNVTEGNLLANEVDVQLHMLGAPMVNGVGGEIDSGDIVTEENGCLVDGTGELGEELT